MVATIKTLHGGAKGVALYFGLLQAMNDYYTANSAGEWFGQAASLLNLSGQVERTEFENLLAGRTPGGQVIAGIRPDSPTSKRRRVPGYDLTLSVPKSISVLWAISNEQMQAAIVKSVHSAAQSTLNDLEKFVPLARRGNGGKRELSAKIVAAMFLHTLSRANDPQLHVHCVIANVCRGEDGQWSSVNSRKLHEWTMALGSIFRTQLMMELTQALKVETYTPILKDGREADWFELKCIPKSLTDEFSTRRREIEKAVDPERLSDANARQKANFRTREAKSEPKDLTSLRKSWQETARKHGVQIDQLHRDVLPDLEVKETEVVSHVARQPETVHAKQLAEDRPVKALSEEPCNEPVRTMASADHVEQKFTPQEKTEAQPLSEKVYDELFEQTVADLAHREAYYSESQFVAALTTRLRKANTPIGGVIGRVRADLHSRDSVVSLPNTTPALFSSREYFQKEQSLVDDAKTLLQRGGAKVDLKTVHKYSHSGRGLTEEQSKAVFHLLGQSSGLRVLTGVAGSGKSSALKSVREGFQKAGHEVVGTALSGKASGELESKTGIPTRTVASYLYHLDRSETQKFKDAVSHEAKMLGRAAIGKRRWDKTPVQLPKNGVLIVDEAGMLDTHSMGRLLHHAKKAKCTVVLAGDSEQLPPINVGGPLGFLKDQAGHADLQTNLRQKSPADKAALESFRQGNIYGALQSYRERDRLQISKTPEEDLVEQWSQSGAFRQPHKHIILTPTRRQESVVNQMCQERRLREKRVPLNFSIRHGENRYYVGDRIRFRRTQAKDEIKNGDFGTVVGVNPIRRTLSVRIDRDLSTAAKKNSRATQIASISLLNTDAKDLSLGYASTTHAAQGAGYDHAWVLLDGGCSSKELAYTQLSRGSRSTHLFASKQTEIGRDELTRLTANLERESKKNLAHDVMSNIDMTYEH